jgi:uncharacterized membrane protein SpoIIM required for sporulation
MGLSLLTHPFQLQKNAMKNSTCNPADKITSSRLRYSLRNVVGLNFALLAVAIAVGSLTAALSHAKMDHSHGYIPIATDGSVSGAFRFIAHWNLRVIGIIVLGVGTLGVFCVIVLLWIGFNFGMDVLTVAHSWPEVLGLFLSYAPIEVSAFCIASGASQYFSISAARCLFLHEPLRTRAPFLALAVAITMLLGAAFIEAHAAQTIQRMVRITDGRIF